MEDGQDSPRRLKLEPVVYASLNAREKETYNFQKVSAVLADFGFRTIRLTEDWESADFIAFHNDGSTFLKLQLKGRLSLDTKYWKKGIYICFPLDNDWFLYPHDEALMWGINNGRIGRKGWKLTPEGQPTEGAYTWPHPPKDWLIWLEDYRLPSIEATGLSE